MENKIENTENKPKKIKKTLFWGIEIKKDQILSHPKINQILSENPTLIPLKSMHSTLLYVGRKDDIDECMFAPFRFKKCRLVVSSFGFSENAMALKVDSMKFTEDSLSSTEIPTYATTQHITVALADGVKAVDSVKTLQGEGKKVIFDIPLILDGTLMCYK